jgi:DNA-binding NtrC family response regulator
VSGMRDALLKRLEEYRWPGNVRELRNTIERATILAGSGLIGVDHLPPHFGEPGFAPLSNRPRQPGRDSGIRDVEAIKAEAQRLLDDRKTVHVEVGTTVNEAEKQLILRTLDSTHNNKTKAAEILGISAKTLQNKLKEYSSAEDSTE